MQIRIAKIKMEIDLTKPDSYGFYICNNKQTYSRYQILLDGAKSSDVRWYYNDHFFDTFDWKTEPPQNLDSLYLARAEQLRSKYDYLILHYSGGSDSDNILNTFVKNGIHIDEICHHVYSGESNSHNMSNREISQVAAKKVKYLIETLNLKTIQRFYDIKEDVLNFFDNGDSKELYYYCNISITPYTYLKPVGSAIQRTHVEEWKQLTASGKKLAMIYGCEKPLVTHKNGRFFFNYSDSLQYHMSVRSQIEGNFYNGCVDELFYWGPTKEAVSIVIKQSHIIKNFLKSPINRLRLKLYYKQSNVEEFNSWYYNSSGNLECKFGGSLFKSLIYSSWNDTSDPFREIKKQKFMDIKTIGNVLTFEKDAWLFNAPESELQVCNFFTGLEQYNKIITDEWISQKSGQSKMIEFKGKLYPRWIKKLKSKNYYLD